MLELTPVLVLGIIFGAIVAIVYIRSSQKRADGYA